MNELLNLAILGALSSTIMEWVKNRYADKLQQKKIKKLLAVIVSVVVGTAYFYLQGTHIWVDIIGVLAAMSTVYAIIYN